MLTGKLEDLFRVRVVLDSVPRGMMAPSGRRHRLLTFQLTYPRILLAELNTHRQMARSTESSRAQPPESRLAQVLKTPYRPLRWGQRVRGMGAGADLEVAQADAASRAWEGAILDALAAGRKLADAGLAKEEVNRVVEPFSLCRTVITSSAWDNFYALRTHETAHPAFTFLARAMYVAQRRSTPRELRCGEWHLPYIAADDMVAAALYAQADTEKRHEPFPAARLGNWADYHLCRWSAARCARVSYDLFGKRKPLPADDDKTWANLAGMRDGDDPARFAWEHPQTLTPGEWPYRPIHASPMEHQGTPTLNTSDARWNGNLAGWVQFRKLLGGECVLNFSPPDEVVRGWERDIPEAVFSGEELY